MAETPLAIPARLRFVVEAISDDGDPALAVRIADALQHRPVERLLVRDGGQVTLAPFLELFCLEVESRVSRGRLTRPDLVWLRWVWAVVGL